MFKKDYSGGRKLSWYTQPAAYLVRPFQLFLPLPHTPKSKKQGNKNDYSSCLLKTESKWAKQELFIIVQS